MLLLQRWEQFYLQNKQLLSIFLFSAKSHLEFSASTYNLKSTNIYLFLIKMYSKKQEFFQTNFFPQEGSIVFYFTESFHFKNIWYPNSIKVLFYFLFMFYQFRATISYPEELRQTLLSSYWQWISSQMVLIR